MRPCIIVLNKIDLLDKIESENLINRLKEKFSHIPDIPVILTSAKEEKNREDLGVRPNNKKSKREHILEDEGEEVAPLVPTDNTITWVTPK